MHAIMYQEHDGSACITKGARLMASADVNGTSAHRNVGSPNCSIIWSEGELNVNALKRRNSDRVGISDTPHISPLNP